MTDASAHEALLRMVERQIEARGVHDERTLQAMRSVPRERFVPADLAEFAFEDAPLPIEEGQTISQPYVVALMIEALELQPDDRMLDVGLGSGYAAAVAARIVREVRGVERFAVLAELARERLERLGFDNVHVRCGDGTLGWPEHAPYDAILVSAGGPDVPPSLTRQLAIGGRMVIPVGADPRTQELVRLRRIAEDHWEQESLGRVQFVPLVGSEGWTADGMPVPSRRARRPLRIEPPRARSLSALIARCAEPFADLDEARLGPLLERIGHARVVLIGEATHGTSEFYRLRARITDHLIRRCGFTVVAIEGDWPDVRSIDGYVRRHDRPFLRTPAFSRFPTWMWRNEETRLFVDRLAAHNEHLEPEHQVSVHGLDIYSLNNSIGAVLEYLERVDPVAAEAARVRYACFTPWELDPATYGRAASGGRIQSCEVEAVATAVSLLEKRLEYVRSGGESWFDAERNAAVVREAERYYRAMYRGSRESWNLRDRHMFDTLRAVMHHRGPGTRAVVWAHNSHVGNAAATEMGVRGELNIGQLAREHFGLDAFLIGFGTHEGTVAAASNWNEPMQVMRVRPSHPDSYERLCHETGTSGFLLPLRMPRDESLREELLQPRLERAIGVIYRPQTEVLSHYFQAALPAQFDEYIWLDRTTAVEPLKAHVEAGSPETWPFGL